MRADPLCIMGVPPINVPLFSLKWRWWTDGLSLFDTYSTLQNQASHLGKNRFSKILCVQYSHIFLQKNLIFILLWIFHYYLARILCRVKWKMYLWIENCPIVYHHHPTIIGSDQERLVIQVHMYTHFETRTTNLKRFIVSYQ